MKKLAIAALAVVNMSMAQAAVLNTQDTPAGKVYTDADNMTLYTFDKDTKGESACYGGCAEKWPPYLVEMKATKEALPKGMTMVTRKDGQKQWALNGQPLYRWFKDTAPGEASGDNVKGVWHVIKG